VDARGAPAGAQGGWLALGVLNEAFLALVRHADPGTFWREACARARWAVPARRLCVVLAAPDEAGAAVVERVERGASLGPLPDRPRVDAWLRAALEARRAGWHHPPWGEAREADDLRAWLLEGDPAAVLHAPLQSGRGALGSLLFAVDAVAEADRPALIASATTYALYAGATFAALQGAADLAAAGAALRQGNEELARKNDELTELHAELRRQLDRARAQHEQVLSLSAPIVEAWRGALALPLVGAIDEERAARITERVLAAVADRGARWVILDLTGAVPERATAARLAALTRAVALLGARCAISGVSAAFARDLVDLGEDLGPVPTFASLYHALAHALGEGRRGR